MQKAFCLVCMPKGGQPFAKAADSLDILVREAKSARVSGKVDGKDVGTVFVLSSEAVGPVLKYRCGRDEKAPQPVEPPKKKK